MHTASEAVRFVLLSSDLRFVGSSAIHQGNDIGEKAASLARALVCSPIWTTMGPGYLVLRTEPVPALAALGRFDAADLARLEYLARWLEPAVTSLRYVDYPEVTDAVVRLADLLLDEFGPDVRSFEYAGVPRGGLIVFGLLSYALDLNSDAISPSRHRPLVVVDDCALTGNRLARFMSGLDRKSVIFAHLCSPCELRASMVERVPSLTHALAAFDLPDLAPERLGDRYSEWHAEATEHAGRDRYWIGQAETIVFPWNEPDQNFWNSASDETEWGWRIAPPDMCLKNARSPGSPGASVQVQSRARGPWAPADHQIWASYEDAIFLLDVITGSTLSIDGVGATIWNGIMSGTPIDEMAMQIAVTHDVEADTARLDAFQFVDELTARGILTKRDPRTS